MKKVFSDDVIRKANKKGLVIKIDDKTKRIQHMNNMLIEYALLAKSGDVAGAMLNLVKLSCMLIVYKDQKSIDIIFERGLMDVCEVKDFDTLVKMCDKYLHNICVSSLETADQLFRRDITNDVIADLIIQERNFLLSVFTKAAIEKRLIEDSLDYSLSQIIPVYERLNIDTQNASNSVYSIEASLCESHLQVGLDSLDVFTKASLLARIISLSFLSTNYGYCDVEILEIMSMTIAEVANIKQDSFSLTKEEVDDMRAEFFEDE